MPRSVAPGTGYPITIVREARRLRADEDLSALKIAERLRDQHGLPSLHRETVLCWLDPAYADRRRSRSIHRGPWKFRLHNGGGSGPTDEYKEAFVLRLRAEGLPATSIAKVCSVVFDDAPTAYRVRSLLADLQEASK